MSKVEHCFNMTAIRKELDASNWESDIDNHDFPKGPTEEGESDSPSHCDACHCFLESQLTNDGVDGVLERVGNVLRGEQCGEVLQDWICHYEGSDTRISLGALAESGLTIGEVLDAMVAKDAEIKRLTATLAAQRRGAD